MISSFRTFLESEVSNTTLRKDLYDKMVKMNPSEPTPEEFERKAITKLRYMQFREKGSSSSTLGFRIEAIRVCYLPRSLTMYTTNDKTFSLFDVLHPEE